MQNPAWQSTHWLAFGGDSYDTTNPQGTNEMFSFEAITDTKWDTYDAKATSSFIDLRSNHNVYVHSPSFGHYTSIGPMGVRTILCKIPVESAYGTVINYAHSGSSYDFIEVGTSALRMLSFSLLAFRMNKVDTKGSHWSMTICLAEEEA